MENELYVHEFVTGVILIGVEASKTDGFLPKMPDAFMLRVDQVPDLIAKLQTHAPKEGSHVSKG